jgi:ABC-2 type transport system ATP-binding protein
MTSLTIEARDLWRNYAKVEALQGLDLNVPEGSCYALIGANGAGKSTTLKLLVNMLEPSRGFARVLGVDSRHLKPATFQQIGYVSEDQELPAKLSVAEYQAYLAPFYPSWDQELAASLCTKLQLPTDRPIGSFSHGMRIKAALLCALPFRPKLLILDEPFSGLDPLVREEFMEGLLSQAGECTMIVSSQELAEIENVATHVGFIHSGRMRVEQPLSELNERLRQVRITLEPSTPVPANLPREWLQVQTFGNVLTFIDTQYEEAALSARLATLFGTVRHVDVAALPLKQIFTTLARAARDGAST